MHYAHFFSQIDNIFGGPARPGRWGVENGLHWSLDVAYGKDERGQLGGKLLDPAPNHAQLDQAKQVCQGWC